MEMYVADVEVLLKNFKPYQESLLNIKGEKQKFSDRINEIQKEMSSIIQSSQSLILGGKTQEENKSRFDALQQEGIRLESDFRDNITEMQSSELEKNLELIKDIISDFAKSENISSILNKSAMLYVSDKYDATPRIVIILKSKGLFNEFKKEEYMMA